MNQIFSTSRFIKYAAYQYRMRSKMIFLSVGSAFIAILFILVSMWSNKNNLEQLFWLLGVVGALLYAGNSFPDFRKKETTINFIMIPASVFEKFVFEFIIRIVLYTIMYPVMFYLASHLSVYISEFLFPKRDIFQFDFNFITKYFEITTLCFFMGMYIFITIVFFAGASVIRRYPLIKTLVITGAFVLSVFGYFYFVITKMKLDEGLYYFFYERIKDTEARMFLSIVFVTSAIMILFYAFLKLKEKEGDDGI